MFGFPIAGATVVSPQNDGSAQVSTIIGMPAIFGSDAGLQTTIDVNADGSVNPPELHASTLKSLDLNCAILVDTAKVIAAWTEAA